MKKGVYVYLVVMVVFLVLFESASGFGGTGRIVWSSSRAGDGRISLWAMNPDGSNAVRLTSGFDSALFATIAPDGTRIAFASQDTGVWYIYLIEADGSNLTQFTDFSSAVPDWSPDGSRLIFNSDHDDEPTDTPDLWAMDIDGTNLSELIDNPPVSDFNGQWSPDGKEVLFCSDRTGSYSLYVLNLDSSNVTRITPRESNEWGGRWSPDGNSILFISDRHGQPDIFVMDAGGGNVRRLTDYAGVDNDPAWSPDGLQVVFMSDRSGNPDLWKMNADGTGLVQLTDDKDLDRYPDWGP
jgi:Tol biopolymer transport system component